MRPEVDNSFYEALGNRWYEDDSHAIALLRAESVQKLKYVEEILSRHSVGKGSRILDVGCGAGFITNPLAEKGFVMKGVDLSSGSLDEARGRIVPGSSIEYRVESAYKLQDAPGTYDAVLLLDVLEHVDNPSLAIQEGARVLRPGGVLIFHTFNRTWLSRFLAIKGISFVTRDCPEHVHVYHLFLKPSELSKMGSDQALKLVDIRGIRPRVFHYPFWWSVFHRRVHAGFSFAFSRSLKVGYLGAFSKPLAC